MLTLPHISPHLSLYQSKLHSHGQLPGFPKYDKYYPRTRSCSSTRNSQTFPISADLVSLAHSHSQPTSSLNGHDRNHQPLDSITVGDWLHSCSTIKEIKKAHAVILKCMEDPGVFVNNNLITMYIRFGHLAVARWVFDNMLERNVVSWTAMLNGYQRYSMGKEGILLFVEFVNSGFVGNEQTHVCILNLCSRILHYELGTQLHTCIVKSRLSNSILDSTILHFYARCGDLDCAFKVFDRMQTRDLVTWTTMISACSQNRRGQDAFVMLSEMQSDGIDPNEFTLSSVLDACGEEKEQWFGKQIHCAVIKKAYDIDVYVGTTLVDMYAKCGNIEDSRAVFDGMKRKNAVSWNSIIAGYARNELGDEAIKLYRVMTRLKVPGNDLTMVTILRACGLLGALSTGKEVHAQFFKNFRPGNIFIGSALVWLYCKCGDYASASKVLDYIPNKDVVSWTAMISGCSHLGHEYEALEYLNEMLGEGVEPNHFTYSSVLKACAKLENVEHGKVIHSSINKTPALHNVFVGSALVHMYSKCGHLSEAVRVFDSMPEKNLVSWKAMIVAYARHGLCDEALKLLYRMQAEGFQVDDYILSTVLTSCWNFKWSEESLSHRYVIS